MKKLLILFFIIFLNLNCEEIVKIKELFIRGKIYDGKNVVIIGEAIGEPMGRGYEKWVNVKDINEDYAIGVLMSKYDVKKIEKFGRYRVKGDTLKIKGIYNLNCQKHNGERDIHAVKVEIIQKGEKYYQEIDFKKVIICFILLIVAIFLIYYYHKILP